MVPRAAAPAAEVLTAPQVAELLQSMVKALRAFQMYLPNNPIYQRAEQNLRNAFAPVFDATDELALRVLETDFVWEDQTVYQQPNKNDSLAWTLYKDGLRVLVLRRGAEEAEIARFLLTVNRARFLPADAGDDLLTLLWEEELEHVSYQFSEPFGDGTTPEPGGTAEAAASGTPAADARRAQVAEEAPPRPAGMVNIEDFDSTLYFLEEAELAYIAREVEGEYQRDIRGSSIAILFDVFEQQPVHEVRNEVLDVLDTLFPHLLNARDFAPVARLLRETRALRVRLADLHPVHLQRLETFEAQLSEPSIVRQLIDSLQDATVVPAEEDVGEVLRELRASALETIVAGLTALREGTVRALLERTADRIAAANVPEVLRLLRAPQSEALEGVVALCGRLRLQGAVPGLGEALGHAAPTVRLAAVQALAEIGSPGALAYVDRAIDDDDRQVRLAAVRAVGARGYKGALRRVEAVVLGKSVRSLDLTEKMAFFEAYGTMAGAGAVETLEQILAPRGLLKRKESPETRACAAIALGRIGSEAAREILERVAQDKELVVRNAALRALREARDVREVRA